MKALMAAIKQKNIVIGTKAVLRGLRVGTIETLYIAENIAPTIKRDLTHYTKTSEVALIESGSPVPNGIG